MFLIRQQLAEITETFTFFLELTINSSRSKLFTDLTSRSESRFRPLNIGDIYEPKRNKYIQFCRKAT